MADPDSTPPMASGQASPPTTADQQQPSESIQVEVAFAKPEVQVIVPLQVPAATTAAEAIQRSELAARFPELEPLTYKYGIFGKVCKPDQVLRSGDRVEIYRPLIADPKQVRKDRAAKGKKTRKGAKAIANQPADQAAPPVTPVKPAPAA